MEETIIKLGLGHCRNTTIGDELRRVCVGIELLLRPNVLLLDEPTSWYVVERLDRRVAWGEQTMRGGLFI